MNKEFFFQQFPLGSHLCREPMPPMKEMKRDLELLKRHGFQMVKLQENWAVDEPVEGRCDFSRYEELIDHAARLEMGIYLGMTNEQAPNWLWEKYPDARMVQKNGLPVAYQAQSTNPADGKPGPCYDHPGARKEMLRFTGQLVRALGRYENIVVWNTWQEIEYWPERLLGRGAEVCFCPHTLRHFQQWLREKYGGIDVLNHAWNTRHAGFESVLPERIIDRKICLPVDMDWKYFMENVQIERILEQRAAVVRENDPLGRPVFAHLAFPKPGNPNVFTYAQTQDFVGTSCYPCGPLGHAWDDIRHTGKPRFEREAALLEELWDKVLLRMDILRSAHRPDQPLWVAELQSGPSCKALHKGRVPDAQDIRRWMLGSVFCGATGIAFWVTRAEIMACELNGFSLLDGAGPGTETTPRLEEAARLGAFFNRHSALFGQRTDVRAPIAILVDADNYYTFESLESGGENLAYSLRGWHRILLELGYAVDFLPIGSVSADTGCQALVLPFPVALSEENARRLEDYANAGGRLICEACPGRLNAHGYARRGELSPTMARLCGVSQSGVTLVREPGDGMRWTPPERTWGEFAEPAVLSGTGRLAGHNLRANYYLQSFDCTDSEPLLLLEDRVAGSFRQTGQGAVYLLGTVAGHGGTAYADAESRSFLRALLGLCGLAPEHAGRLLLRRRVQGGLEAWMLLNPTGCPVTESLAVGDAQVQDMEGRPVEVRGGKAAVTVPPVQLGLWLVRRGTAAAR